MTTTVIWEPALRPGAVTEALKAPVAASRPPTANEPKLVLSPSDAFLLQSAARPVEAVNRRMDGGGCREISERALAIAILALEKEDSIRFEDIEHRHLFGLISWTDLAAVRSDNHKKWPLHSLEARFLEQLMWVRPTKIEALIYNWLGDNYESPWLEAVNRLYRSLVSRGLAEAWQCQGKTLWIFPTEWTEYRARLEQCPASLRADAAAALDLLTIAPPGYVSVAYRITCDIDHAFARRTINTD